VLTVPGHIQAGDVVVHDASDHAPIQWTVTGIMAHSSNIGTLMLDQQLGNATLEQYMRAFGLGAKTGAGLPGESGGILQPSKDWSASHAANVPIGQGVSVTTLQLASVYQTIANGGVRIPPRVVASVTTPDGTVTPQPAPAAQRVISASTASAMTYMLESVISKHGTAPGAAVPGYLVAGKTGTAQRANPACGCYAGGGYNTTFVGFAPADDPQYVVAVDLERPTSDAEGGEVAAPVFADVMRAALVQNGVVPSGAAPPTFVLTPGG
jgi:cell division protein FtsI (penicillin-binding protein 3)